MGRIAIATRAFFKSLFDAQVAAQVESALNAAPIPALPEPASSAVQTQPPAPVAPPKPTRSDALTLLATLQREARFVDFIQEPLDSYTDTQIGAAVRDVHRDTAAVLQRLFELRKVCDVAEGEEMSMPHGQDSAKYRLTGNVTEQTQTKGRLVHAGWEATRCDMPVWNGSESVARLIAPAEIEI